MLGSCSGDAKELDFGTIVRCVDLGRGSVRVPKKWRESKSADNRPTAPGSRRVAFGSVTM